MQNEFYSFETIKDTIMNWIGEQTVSKYPSSAECNAARKGAEGIIYALEEAGPDITLCGSLILPRVEDKPLEKPVKKTGYERVEYGNYYFTIDNDCIVHEQTDDSDYDDTVYQAANYYSDKTVAKNNARADTLLRKLRRFAVEHRKKELDWENDCQSKVYIEYCHDRCAFEIDEDFDYQSFGKIYFDSEETAEAAINEFKDELLWYFTEYKDSL